MVCEDLIGRVVSITKEKVIQVHSKPQRLIDLVIEDTRGSRLTITLWDEHVDSALPYYNADLADPLIVILQLYGEVRISSSYTATKIMFNYECPEFFKFKESLPRFLTPLWSISSRSRISGSGTIEALSSENITLTSLKDIYDNKKVCGKKLQDCTDQMYCKPCNTYSPDGIIKYKVVIDVLDDDQDGPLVLWDNVCSTLLGVTASELKEKYSKDGCMPNEIKDLIGKTMMFRIVTRNDQFKYSGNTAFTVLGVKKDEAIAQTHQPKLLNKSDEGTVVIPPLDATSSSLPEVILVDESTPEEQSLKRTNIECSSSSRGMKKPKIEPKN
nr:replication protein A 70 kDa DNA-binding subunit B-like [Ipomoea batatas]